jgi:putative ATP-binding cassette transporter
LNVPADSNAVVENPDQRIADDVRAFTTTTLSFVLLLTNALLTVIAFSGVMWTISPMLFSVAVLYAVLGSVLTVLLGRPLMGLNYDQLDKEADFRSELIHVRENAESIALNRDESQLRSRTLRYFDALQGNTERIISVNRRLGFFTTGYNNLIALIPALIIAPLFMRGEVEFGVITQAAMAFGQLLGAFSLIVTQFQSISWFAAVIVRLGSLMEAMDQAQTTGVSAIERCEQDNVLVYDKLSLQSPRDGRTLLKELSVSIPEGMRLLVTGEDESAKLALFRATAGIWHTGSGRIISPGCDAMLFLPEHPYVPPGSLRQLCARGNASTVVSDDLIEKTLEALDLEHVWKRAGGVDIEHDWSTILSLGELQLLAVARVCLALPRFVFLDRLGTSLSEKHVERALGLLSKLGVTYLSIGNSEDKPEDHDAILSIAANGEWKMRRLAAGENSGEVDDEQH